MIDARVVRGFVAWRHRNSVGGRSIQRGLSALRTFFDFCMREAMMTRNPARAVSAPKASRRLPNTLDTDRAGALVELDGEDRLSLRDRAMLELTYSSGLRLSELCALAVADADLEGGLVRVLGKGRKVRVVPIGRHAREAGAGVACGARGSCRSRRERSVREPARAQNLGAYRTGAVRQARPRTRDRGPRPSAHAAPFVRDSPAGVERRPARGAGAARPCRHRDHPGLHPPGFPASRGGLRSRPSAGAQRSSLTDLTDSPRARAASIQAPERCGFHLGIRPCRYGVQARAAIASEGESSHPRPRDLHRREKCFEPAGNSRQARERSKIQRNQTLRPSETSRCRLVTSCVGT